MNTLEISTGNSYSYFSFADYNNNYTNFSTVGNVNYSNAIRTCVQTLDKGFLMAGSITPYDTIPKYNELYLIKLDSLGVEQWDTTYFDYDYNSWFTDIIPESDTTFILLGSVNYNYLGIGDVLVTKIDQSGNRLWSEIYDLGGEEQARECILTQDGSIVFTAGSFGISPSSTIVKISQNGELVWSINNYFDGCGGARMIELVDSSLVFTGCLDIDDAPEKNQLQVVKLAANGDFQWSRLYGGDDDDYGYDIIINDFDSTGKSGYVLTGRTESNLGPGLANVYFLKLNCLGLLTEPQAHFEAALTDLSVQFTNLSQYVYPDSIDGGHYMWDFGDGTSSTALEPFKIYPSFGIYEAQLSAIVCNDTSIHRQTLCIGMSPMISPSFTQFSTMEADGIHSAFSSTSQFLHPETLELLSPTDVTYFWDFGDGTTANDPQPTHIYAQAGIYEVTLTTSVCDHEATISETICIGVPTVDFTTEITAPLTVQFTNLSTYLLADTTQSLTYVWDFGDGAFSNEVHPLHEFPNTQDGLFEVGLTVVFCGDTVAVTEEVGVLAIGIDGHTLQTHVSQVRAFYPNPASQKTVMNYDIELGKMAILEAFDVTGRLLKKVDLEGKGSFEMDLTDWSDGIYFYQVRLLSIAHNFNHGAHDSTSILREKLVVVRK